VIHRKAEAGKLLDSVRQENRGGKMRVKRIGRGLRTVALVSTVIPLACSPVVAQGSVEEVWQMEESYWDFVKARDFEGYLRLWHEDFVGWQCAEPEPGGVEGIGDWVRDLRDDDAEVSYELRREAVQPFGPTVVVHYAVRWTFRYPDGQIVGNETWRKITHTWIKVDGRWWIAGGMCADLAELG
jgi:ketosteroid isomerase-like protein